MTEFCEYSPRRRGGSHADFIFVAVKCEVLRGTSVLSLNSAYKMFGDIFRNCLCANYRKSQN